MKQKEIEKIKRRNLNLCELYDFCRENEVDMYQVNDWFVKLNKRIEITVDVYPTNKRFCIFNRDDYGLTKWYTYNDPQEILPYL